VIRGRRLGWRGLMMRRARIEVMDIREKKCEGKRAIEGGAVMEEDKFKVGIQREELHQLLALQNEWEPQRTRKATP